MLNCADCDEINPQWCSLNRGVVLCDNCSSIHRQLGRHVSQIKNLTQSRCRKTQLMMLSALSQSGANKYWEHLLLESSLRKPTDHIINYSPKFRKPTPKDATYTTKKDFIKEKYLFFGFFKKPRMIVLEDLCQQLHASVRTAFIETSLYLLTLGAQPNYLHPTRGTSSLHVATSYNQPLQVELLLTYGADLLLTDGNGDTPLQIAYKNSQSSQEPLKWQVLITCLLEAQFEITDSLSYYLCRQTIDHSLTDLTDPSSMINNFLIPKFTDDKMINGSKQNIEIARSRLQHLPKQAFVDLCIDIYDDIDRRDTNDIITSQNPDSELTLYFLPPNPHYTSTRNQGRQKLARLSVQEFRALCHDVLIEASVRLCPQSNRNQPANSTCPEIKKHRSSLPLAASLDSCLTTNDPEPIYDQVAPDLDCVYGMDLHRPQANLSSTFCVNEMDSVVFRNKTRVPFENPSSSCIIKSLDKPHNSKENSFNVLLNKIDDLTGNNKLLQSRTNDLEKKVECLKSQITQLKHERSALIVALSQNNYEKHNTGESKIRSRAYSNHTESNDSDYWEEFTKQAKMVTSNIVDNTYDIGSGLFNSGTWLRPSPTNTVTKIYGVHNNKSFNGTNKSNVDQTRFSPAQPVVLRYYNSTDEIDCPPTRVCSERREASLSRKNTSVSPNSSYRSRNMSMSTKYPVSASNTSPIDDYYCPAISNEHTPNQVATCVETIMLQIRALLEIVNAKKQGNLLQCSMIIQSATNYLVRLFSTTDRRYITNPGLSSKITVSLRDLLSYSHDLRTRCEKRCLVMNRSYGRNEYDTAPIIKNTQEIAMAAKLLFSHYKEGEIKL